MAVHKIKNSCKIPAAQQFKCTCKYTSWAGPLVFRDRETKGTSPNMTSWYSFTFFLCSSWTSQEKKQHLVSCFLVISTQWWKRVTASSYTDRGNHFFPFTVYLVQNHCLHFWFLSLPMRSFPYTKYPQALSLQKQLNLHHKPQILSSKITQDYSAKHSNCFLLLSRRQKSKSGRK